jgi:hypothetical protein
VRRLPLPLVPFLAAALLHLGALRGGFHFDDVHAVAGNPAIGDLRNVPSFFADPARFSAAGEGSMYRPLLLMLHAVNAAQARGTGSAIPWLVTNLLLHAACSSGVFLLVRSLLRRRGVERSEVPALAASLLFALHPLAAEVVDYVSARSSSLSFGCTLAALLAHLRARERGGAWWAAPMLLGTAAMLSRETAVGLPILVGILEGLLPGTNRGRAFRTIPSLLLALGFLALRSAVLGTVLPPSTARDVEPEAGWGRSLSTNVVLQTLACVRFLGLLLWPQGLTVDHTFPRVGGLGDPLFLLSAAILLVVALLAAALIRRPLCVLGFSLVAWGLAPYFLAPLNVVFAEHRAYPSLAGACLVLGDGATALLAAWPGRAALLKGASAVGLLALAGRSAARDADWRAGLEDLPLWESALRVSPDSFRAHHGVANALFEKGDLDGAERHYREALATYPRYDAARLSLASVLVRRTDPAALDEAVALLDELLARRPGHVLARFKLAGALEARFLLGGNPADAARCDQILRALAAENPSDRNARVLHEVFRRERVQKD